MLQLNLGENDVFFRRFFFFFFNFQNVHTQIHTHTQKKVKIGQETGI